MLVLVKFSFDLLDSQLHSLEEQLSNEEIIINLYN